MYKALFILAGLVNIFAVIVFSKGYSNNLSVQYWEVFSVEDLFGIQLWGLAYIATAFSEGFPYSHKALCFVFFLEKIFYALTWVRYMMKTKSFFTTRLTSLVQEDPLTGVFFWIYGINDFVFAIVFLVAALAKAPKTQVLTPGAPKKQVKKD